MHIKNGDMRALYAENDGEFAGFALVFPFESIALTAFLAVPSTIRNGGTGTKMLDFLKKEYADKTLTIEIEDITQPSQNPEIRQRRRGFYLRNGFIPAGFASMLYGTQLEVLCIGEPITPDVYMRLQQKMLCAESFENIHIA